jgi:predicted AAA+ superfamily ATPase
VFEGFVAAEIVKVQVGGGWPRQLYYFRDQQGLEVDFIVPMGNGRLINLEAKASRTVAPGMATSLQRLATATTRYRVESFVVHRKTEAEPATSVLSPGVKALALGELLDILRIRGARRAL